jgi:hypothetical protein
LGILGHGPKCIILTFWYVILCLMGSAMVKYIFYHLVGLFFGMVPTTPMDDFWMYDYPINPICVPFVFTFDRPKEGTVEAQWDTIVKRIKPGHRTRTFMVKKFGKYFLKEFSSLKEFKVNCCPILYDLKTD